MNLKMTKDDATRYVNDFKYSFSDLIGMSVDEDDCFMVMFGGKSGHHIVFDNDFSNWSIALVEDNVCIYAKVGQIKHKKFNRDIGMLFFLDDKKTKIESYCLVQNIKNRLHLEKLD